MALYPEHEKLQKAQNESNAIGAFLEWLQSEHNIQLASYHKHDDSCYNDEIDLTCELSEHRLIDSRKSITDWLSEYFGINQKKLENEKLKMLQQIRDSHKVKA